MVVRVLPDVPAIDRPFDYLVPERLRDQVRVGTIVRINLHGRNVAAWVLDVGVEPPEGVELKPIRAVTGRGPAADVIDLARWAAWRWGGRWATFLRTASPPGVVRQVPGRVPPPPVEVPALPATVADALARPRAVLRLAPATDRWPLLLAAATADDGDCLVLCPSVVEARRVGERLHRLGLTASVLAHQQPGTAAAGEWARAAGGATVVGARAAAFAPLADLARVVVLDEHDEGYQGEGSPTWHARDVVVQRAARAGVPCLLVSPCPSLEALEWGGPPLSLPRVDERSGWPVVEAVDRRDDDPVRGGLWSERLVRVLQESDRVVCVLNRTGRARLLACGQCGELTRCEACDAAVEQIEGEQGDELSCRRCGTRRPVVCLRCGATKLRTLRLGVTRAREELEAMLREPVGEITGAGPGEHGPRHRVVVGTEAVLHQVSRADVVAFLEFDQELGAIRYRGAEEALALLVRAARLVRAAEGGPSAPGRSPGLVLVQTRQPDHPVLEAARHGDPGRLVDGQRRLRRAMGYPPFGSFAVVQGPGADEFVASFGRPEGVQVLGGDGSWQLRAATPGPMCDAIARTPRPAGRLRLAVDPARL